MKTFPLSTVIPDTEVIEKTFSENSLTSSAIYSQCQKYRYCLSRTWDLNNKNLLYIMLNPSEATEVKTDPTIQRCQYRAITMSFSALRVCNLFGLRSKNPKALFSSKDPVGSYNDHLVKKSIQWASQIICAWGSHGIYLNRDLEIIDLLKLEQKPIYHLGLTKMGKPKHPLYISYQTKLIRWF